MEPPATIDEYLKAFANELGERILESFPPLHGAEDPPSPLLSKLLRKPYAAQSLTVMAVVKRLAQARSAAVVAECGTGKTLISLASIYVAAGGGPFAALVMVPSHLTQKWLRESLKTIPHLRAFLIEGLRDRCSSSPNGIQEFRFRNGRIVREGLKTTLTDLGCARTIPAPVRGGMPYVRARRYLWFRKRPPSSVSSGGMLTTSPGRADTRVAS